jgi:hypothetical protein
MGNRLIPQVILLHWFCSSGTSALAEVESDTRTLSSPSPAVPHKQRSTALVCPGLIDLHLSVHKNTVSRGTRTLRTAAAHYTPSSDGHKHHRRAYVSLQYPPWESHALIAAV